MEMELVGQCFNLFASISLRAAVLRNAVAPSLQGVQVVGRRGPAHQATGKLQGAKSRHIGNRKTRPGHKVVGL